MGNEHLVIHFCIYMLYIVMISCFFVPYNTALQKARTIIPLDDDGSDKNSGNELAIICTNNVYYLLHFDGPTYLKMDSVLTKNINNK